MNTQVPVITVSEFEENFEFIIESLVGKNKMSFRIDTDGETDVLLVPVIEKSPVPETVLRDLEEMQKQLEDPGVVNISAPPLDIPF